MKALVLLAFVAAVASAQSPPAPVAGTELEVYVMTMGPGDYVYERFGHNALGVRDRSSGTDVVYNWGTFSFGDPDFVPRFLTGTMRYWVQAGDAAFTIAAYQQMNRSVWIQELNLTPAERIAVRDFVAWNVREENRFYRYDFFGDNCSTRVRDVLDQVLSGKLHQQLRQSSARSYRDEVVRLTSSDFWTSTGIDLALGPSADHIMSQWEAGFIPMALRDGLRGVKNGVGQPLVASEREVFAAARPAEPVESSWMLRNVLIGISLALLVLVLARYGGSAGASAAAGVTGTICAVCGVFGVVLLLIWFVTEHRWMHANANLLMMNPLWLLVIPPSVRWRRPLRRFDRWIIATLAALGCVAVVVATGGWPQQTATIAALVLPVQLVTLVLLLRRPRDGARA